MASLIILAGQALFNKNAHNSWTACYILFKFCILLYFNIVQPLVCETVKRLHRAATWPVNLLIFDKILYAYVFLHFPATGMQNGARLYRATFLPSSSVSENAHDSWPHGIFSSNFIYLCILKLSSNWFAKRWWGFTEHHVCLSSSTSENANNSCTAWYIWFNCCILLYYILDRELPGFLS